MLCIKPLELTHFLTVGLYPINILFLPYFIKYLFETLSTFKNSVYTFLIDLWEFYIHCQCESFFLIYVLQMYFPFLTLVFSLLMILC